nr:MAG TPA: hypothetical protein [Caudoviricetes sp.]
MVLGPLVFPRGLLRFLYIMMLYLYQVSRFLEQYES